MSVGKISIRNLGEFLAEQEMETWFSVESDLVPEEEYLHRYFVDLVRQNTLRSKAIFEFISIVLKELNGKPVMFWDNFKKQVDFISYVEVEYAGKYYEVEMELVIVKYIRNRSFPSDHRIYEFRMDFTKSRLSGDRYEVFGDTDVVLRGIFQVGKVLVELVNTEVFTYKKYCAGIFDKAYSNGRIPKNVIINPRVDKTNSLSEGLHQELSIQYAIKEVDKND